MSTVINTRGPVRHGAQNTSVGNGVGVTLSITAPAAHERVVIDSISYGFSGATQVSNSVNIQDAGGGVVYWVTYSTSGIAGFCSQQWTFPSGLLCPIGQAVEFTAAALTNCAQRVSISYHYEGSA